jgi:hypothetical protein
LSLFPFHIVFTFKPKPSIMQVLFRATYRQKLEIVAERTTSTRGPCSMSIFRGGGYRDLCKPWMEF